MRRSAPNNLSHHQTRQRKVQAPCFSLQAKSKSIRNLPPPATQHLTEQHLTNLGLLEIYSRQNRRYLCMCSHAWPSANIDLWEFSPLLALAHPDSSVGAGLRSDSLQGRLRSRFAALLLLIFPRNHQNATRPLTLNRDQISCTCGCSV